MLLGIQAQFLSFFKSVQSVEARRLGRLALTAMACFWMLAACWYHVPDAEQDDVFPCENDRHCIEGYLCRNGFCTSQPPPENPPAEPAAVEEDEEKEPEPQEELSDTEEEIASFCGNGRIDGVEECDAGDSNSDTVSGACRNHCAKAFCGDGVLDPGEGCDDGNAKTDDCPYGDLECEVCTAQCRLGPGIVKVCGDGIVDTADEDCDDGNAQTEVCAYSSDAQDAACLVCTRSCQLESGKKHYCGDGVIDADEGEVCDLGYAQLCAPSDASCQTCWQNCTLGESDNQAPKIVFNDVQADAQEQFLTGHQGERIFLDARLSFDPEGGSLAYHWRQTGGSPVMLHDAHQGRASFLAPKAGDSGLEFQVVATDLSDQSASATVHIEILETDENILDLLRKPATLFEMTLGKRNRHVDALNLRAIHAAKITQNGRMMLWGSVEDEAGEDASILAIVAMDDADSFATQVFEAPAKQMHYVLSRDFDTALGLLHDPANDKSVAAPYFVAWKDGRFVSTHEFRDIFAVCSAPHLGSCGAKINGYRFAFQRKVYRVAEQGHALRIERVLDLVDNEHVVFGQHQTFIYREGASVSSVCTNDLSGLDHPQTSCIQAYDYPSILQGDTLHDAGELLLFPDEASLPLYAQRPISFGPSSHAWYAPGLYFRPKLASNIAGPFQLDGYHTSAKQGSLGMSVWTQKHDLADYAAGANTQLYPLGHRHLMHRSETANETVLTLHDLQEQEVVHTVTVPKFDTPILEVNNILWTAHKDTLLWFSLDNDGLLQHEIEDGFAEKDAEQTREAIDLHMTIYPHAQTVTAFFEQEIIRAGLDDPHNLSKVSLETGSVFAVSMLDKEDGFVVQASDDGYRVYPLHYDAKENTLSLGGDESAIMLPKQPRFLDGETVFFTDGSRCVLPQCSQSMTERSFLLDQESVPHKMSHREYSMETAPQNGYAWYRNPTSSVLSRWPVLMEASGSDLRPIYAFERYKGALPPHAKSIHQKLLHYRDQNSGSLIYRTEFPAPNSAEIRCLVSSGHCRRKGDMCIAWDAPSPDAAISQLLVMTIDHSVSGTLFYDIRASDAETPMASDASAPFTCQN